MAILGKLKKNQDFKLNRVSKLYYALSDIKIIRGKKYRAYTRANGNFKKFWLPVTRNVIVINQSQYNY